MKNWVIIFLSSLLIPGLVEAAPEFKENVHYELVVPAQPTTTSGNKVEVVEMFWYGCPHCFHLEPYVNRWLKKKPANVEFVRIPAIFQPSWEMAARAYYTAEVLGVLDKTHSALFDAIHELKKHFSSDADYQKFFEEHGVSANDFKRVFRSFAVEAKIRRAKDMTERYGIHGVPSLIVNGKYRTGAQLAGSQANIFRVVNYLVGLESVKK